MHADLEQEVDVMAIAILVEEAGDEEGEEEEEEVGPAQDTDTPNPKRLVEKGGEAVDDGQKNDQSDIVKVPAQPALVELSEEEEEPATTDSDYILRPITQETPAAATNGIEREIEQLLEHNGTEGSMSSSTDVSSPELAVCYDLHGGPEEDSGAENEGLEFTENGTEVSPERQMCVRALYDYQAEDESEISFEPGDIISEVETVDKAWWRGCSKDGHQGLFPANYVETI